MSTQYETLLVSQNQELVTITINRPQVLNAINGQVLRDLNAAFGHLQQQRPRVRGVILTGAGEKAFVAGADIAAMQSMSALDADEFCALGHEVMKRIEDAPFPVVAAVNGFALGGGLELALACDFIYASSSAKFGLPEVNLGLFPGFGGTQRLARVLGRNRAKEWIYSAQIYKADQALAWGLVNQVCEPDQLLPAVQQALTLIASKSPVAVSLAKRVINEGVDLPLASGLAVEQGQFPLVFASEDKTEGVNAFLEKRPAQFLGR